MYSKPEQVPKIIHTFCPSFLLGTCWETPTLCNRFHCDYIHVLQQNNASNYVTAGR